MHEIMKNTISTISDYKLVPVVTMDDPQKAVTLARALEEGGLPLAEITFRTQAAEESIRRITDSLPHILVGAGTVLTIEQARAAQSAGASFIVAPGFNPKIVDYCLEHDILVVPGVDSPTLIEAALEKGLSLVKFFPAEQSGGLPFLKAIAAPYQGLRFMPTGGVYLKNILKYLGYEPVVACGGSWICPAPLIAKGDFFAITTLTRNAVLLLETIR